MKKEIIMRIVRENSVSLTIAPLVYILSTTESWNSIEEIIMIGVYWVLVELVIKGLYQDGNSHIEECIVSTVLKVLGFFMIYTILTGDRILSFLGFIVLAGLVYFLLYLPIIQDRKIPPRPNWISTVPSYPSN